MYKIYFLHTGDRFSSGRGSFLTLSAAGQAGGSRVHQAQVWTPAWLRGARSGRSMSRELSCNHGIAFRRARTMEDDHISSICYLLHWCTGTAQHSLQAFPVVTATDTTHAYADSAYACVCCVCQCARVCACVCWLALGRASLGAVFLCWG